MVKDTSAKTRRKASSYNMFRSYMKRRGSSLSTTDMSAAWTLANQDVTGTNGAVTRSSFSKQLDKIRGDLSTTHNDAQGNEIKNIPDKKDVLDQFFKKDNSFSGAFEQEYQDYMKQSGRGQQAAAEMARGEYVSTDGKPGRIPKGTDPKSNGSGSGPMGLGTVLQNASQPNTNMGNLNPLTGNFTRSGEVLNAGGGIVDTQVGSSADLGDSITLGPRSTATGKKTLRPKIPLAGSDSVKGTAVEEATSDTIFEAFSFVPEGHGLGVDNPLHQLNQNNEFIRFGVGNLAEPRANDPENGIKDEVPLWNNDQEKAFITSQVAGEAKDVIDSSKAVEKQERQPESFVEDGMDYDHEPSSQALPRVKPTPFDTVYNNRRVFLPSTSPAGLFLSNVPYRPADGRTAHRGEL